MSWDSWGTTPARGARRVSAAEWVIMVLGVLLLAPCLVLAIECVFGSLRGVSESGNSIPPPSSDPSFVVLMPAHDEEGIIEAAVRSVLDGIGPSGRLLVVADNCKDQTALLAEQAGARVIVRDDPSHEGKGEALSFGIAALAESPPDVLVVLDADCRASIGGLARLARAAHSLQRPIQGGYVLAPPLGAGPVARVSAFALAVRNHIRPLGLRRMGLPCHLTGSGMAFPWNVIIRASPTRANLVEDLALAIDLAEKGHFAFYVDAVHIESELPKSSRAAFVQRRRWETGQLSTSFRTVPRLLLRGLFRRNVGVFALGCDLLVPPLALLVLLLTALTVASLVVAAHTSALVLLPPVVGLGLVSVAVLSAYLRVGSKILPARYLPAIPLYVLWKIPLYATLLIQGRERKWIRTKRDHD